MFSFVLQSKVIVPLFYVSGALKSQKIDTSYLGYRIELFIISQTYDLVSELFNRVLLFLFLNLF